MKIELAVKNQGHVPSFKTQKKAAIHKETGMPFVVSKKETKQWMKRCIQNFESQLLLLTLTTGDATLTAPCPPSSIASSLPQDDSRQWLPEIVVRCIEVEPGYEGATIIIEPIE